MLDRVTETYRCTVWSVTNTEWNNTSRNLKTQYINVYRYKKKFDDRQSYIHDNYNERTHATHSFIDSHINDRHQRRTHTPRVLSDDKHRSYTTLRIWIISGKEFHRWKFWIIHSTSKYLCYYCYNNSTVLTLFKENHPLRI